MMIVQKDGKWWMQVCNVVRYQPLGAKPVPTDYEWVEVDEQGHPISQ